MVVTGVPQDKTGEARGFPGNKLAVLRKHPYFCDLEPEAFDQLCRYAKHLTLKRGATIVSKGDPGNSLIAVISGTVKISVSSPDGRSAILNLIGAGEMFGMSRESINKQLRAWAARGWVRLEHGAIVVLNAEMLRELAEAGSDEGD